MKIFAGLSGPNVIGLLCMKFKNVQNKLECSYQAGLSSLVWCLKFRPEPTWVEHLSGAPLQSNLLALREYIRLGWKGLPGTNTPAYYKDLQILDIKGFISSGNQASML